MSGLRLNLSGYQILRVIAEHHDQELALATIAEKAECSKTTVVRSLPKLYTAGLISCYPPPGKPLGRGNHYRLGVKPKVWSVLRRYAFYEPA
jgi:DNA-binding IclR family transcriptional regulator